MWPAWICYKHLLHKEISSHFQLFYFNERLGFCELFELKIKRINNADLFSQASLFIFTKGVNNFSCSISYKILLLAYKALNGLAPAYLTSLLSHYNPSRSLRSQNSGLLVVPRIAKSTKGGRAFSYLAPKLWNSLPDNVRGSDTLSLFKSRLKTSIHVMHSYNASNNLLLQLYLIKRTLLFFSLG